MQEQITAREYHITCEPANYAGGNEEPLVWEFESGVCIMEGAKFWRIHLSLDDALYSFAADWNRLKSVSISEYEGWTRSWTAKDFRGELDLYEGEMGYGSAPDELWNLVGGRKEKPSA